MKPIDSRRCCPLIVSRTVDFFRCVFQVNLLHVDHDHVSTMINTVFSSPRDFATSQPVRSSVVRYLTTKMRSLGLVTGNQLFEPTEFGELVSRTRSKKTVDDGRDCRREELSMKLLRMCNASHFR